jgi:hypothetical protein
LYSSIEAPLDAFGIGKLAQSLNIFGPNLCIFGSTFEQASGSEHKQNPEIL